jgi:UDP-N-acetyl-D-glucosamine dehydrogenase
MNKPSVPSARAEQLHRRIEERSARVAVVGLGYVGLPLAEAFASTFPVLGFDVDGEKVKKLQAGQSYIERISSARLVEMTRTGRFQATDDPRCLGQADAVLICVPTPLTEARDPDLSFITGTGRTLSQQLRPGQLIVLESTTYPGTTEEVLQPILEESGLRAGQDFFLGYSPEREDPGNAEFSTRVIPKVVSGYDPTSQRLAVALYRPVVKQVVPVSSLRVAEAAKILENTYRAVNIALVNELKVIFDQMGIDVWEVIEAAKTKPFGFHAFYPGPGLGGHCIPIDPFYLTWVARKHQVNTRFIELAGEVNTGMPRYVVHRVAEALNEEGKALKGSRVCVLGVAYKKNVDDPRESPAFEIMELLQKRGAQVAYNDPHIPVLPRMRHHRIQLKSMALTDAFLASQDCVVVVTDHSAYQFEHVVRHARVVVDTRNATRGISPGKCKVWKA